MAEGGRDLMVDLFVEAHRRAPGHLDATDAPLHGEQEGRFFHSYEDSYCYLRDVRPAPAAIARREGRI